MIRVYTFTCPLGDRDSDTVLTELREQVGKLLKFQPHLVGFQAGVDADTVVLKIRVAHIRSLRLVEEAKRIAMLLCARVKLPRKQIKLISWETEPSKRDLTLKEGRTEMSKSTAQERAARPSPWADASWWGDTVTSDPISTPPSGPRT